MKEYTLYLDESGNFEETGKYPSVVAGYLMDGNAFTENKAKEIFVVTKNKNTLFEKINIDTFHGMEDYSKEMTEFCVSVLEEMAINQNLHFVCFRNRKNLKIVNSDITYLNVVTDGIIQLLQSLVAINNMPVNLNISYARRKDVTISDTFKMYTPIEESRYKARIEEYLFLRLRKLEESERKNFNYSLSMGDAKKSYRLMLADVVCNCFRGRITTLKSEQKQRIKTICTDKKIFEFKSQENEIWKEIKNSLLKYNIADAVYDWYMYLNENEKDLKKEFYNLLLTTINKIDSKLLEIQYAIIGQRIRTLVDSRKFIVAEKFCENLLKEYFNEIKNSDAISKAFYFDICFYCLTMYTHQGNTMKEMAYIKECDKALSEIGVSYENINYYFRYKLRVAEHYKNIFEFDKAMNILKTLEKFQKDSIILFKCLDVLEGLPEKLHSDNLGKIYGSMVSTICYKTDNTENDYITGVNYSDAAVKEFSKNTDIQRHYLIRCQLEYTFERLENAYYYLTKSLNLDAKENPKKLLQKILEIKHNEFYLMHYVNLMDKKISASKNAHDEMYEAWNLLKVDTYLNEQIANDENKIYPYYIIFWKIGHIKFILKEKSSKTYYEKACLNAIKNVDNYTMFMAGVAILSEQAAIFMDSNAISKDMRRLLKECSKLEGKVLPEKIEIILEHFRKKLNNLKDFSQNDKKEVLLNFVDTVPIL